MSCCWIKLGWVVTTIKNKVIFQSTLARNTVIGQIPNSEAPLTTHDNFEEANGTITPTEKFIEEVKRDTKAVVSSDENEITFTHIQSLVKQGNFLKLTQMQQVDATWKSYIYNLPKGTMKFLINASIDTLPSNVNLSLWGKRTNLLCSLNCGKKETTNHMLNCCQVALPRYLWRHNNILHYIIKCLDI